MTPEERDHHLATTPVHYLDEIYRIPVILDNEIIEPLRDEYIKWITDHCVTCPSIRRGNMKISATFASSFADWLETKLEHYDIPDVIAIESPASEPISLEHIEHHNESPSQPET